MINTSFLSELSRFSLIVQKRVTSKYGGERRSAALGKGIIMKDHRIYVPGDDFRAIDWKIFARTDDLYIKNYEEERSLVVHIILDGSKSMDYGSPNSKFNYASMLGVGFAYLALKQNEKFRFTTFADDLDIFQPKKGMSHLATMVNHLNTLKLKGKSIFNEAMLKYKKTITSRSIIVVVSDFLFDLEVIKEGLSNFKNHDLKVIQVLDKTEVQFNIEGDYKLKDSETGIEINANISPRVKSVYQNKLQEHNAAVQRTCQDLGAKFYCAITDKEVFDVFWEVLR